MISVRDIQMSWLPKPPGRFDANNKGRPLCDRLGVTSLNSVLTGGPRFSGADQVS